MTVTAVTASLAGCGGTPPPEPPEAAPEQLPAAVAARLERFAADVERVAAVRDVKRLQHAYGHYAEFGLWHDLADLFAADAVGLYPTATVSGREAIHDLFFADIGRGALGLAPGRLYPHIMLSPVVTVDADGQRVRGRWRIIAMLGAYGERASWAGGIYENVYVRQDGAWRIGELRYYGQYSGSYSQGWRNAVEESPGSLMRVPFHYDPERAGRPAAATDLRLVPPVDAPDLDALATRFAILERRVQDMLDSTAVQNLQHAYGYYLDRKLWDDVADLFAATGTLELAQRGVYAGRDSIRRALDQFGAAGLRPGELHDHLQLQTVVTIAPDGRTAFARGTEWQMTGAIGGGAEWGLAVFENTYVKSDGSWRIQSMRVYPRMRTNYDAGWAESALPPPEANAEFPPDRPPTEVLASYPDFAVPAFHYAHPVTGRAPQYPAGASVARVPIIPSPLPVRPVPDSVAALETRLAAAERDLDRAQAIDAAENLASAYGYYVDEFMWNDMAELFAADGWKELSYAGTYIGRERIRESVMRRYGNAGRRPNALTLHQTLQPVVAIAADGASGRIRTRLLQLNSALASAGSYIAGVYENSVVLEDGLWKISVMDLDYTWSAPYAGGWAGVAAGGAAGRAVPAGGPAADYPPDRPLRGPAAPPYPDVADMAFHYRNPVSGRVPAILLE